MHNYMIIRSTGRKQWWIEELVSIEIGFVRPNGDTHMHDRLEETTLTPHDISHLAFGIGYTMPEEGLAGHYENIGKFNFFMLFSRGKRRDYHVRAFGRDLTAFEDLIAKINKEGGDYRLDLYGKDLIITKI